MSQNVPRLQKLATRLNSNAHGKDWYCSNTAPHNPISVSVWDQRLLGVCSVRTDVCRYASHAWWAVCGGRALNAARWLHERFYTWSISTVWASAPRAYMYRCPIVSCICPWLFFFHGNLSSTQTTSKLPTVSMMRGCIFNSCNASLVKALYSRTMGSVRRDIHTPSRTHDMHFTKDPVFDSTVNLKSNKRGKQWE